MSCLTAEQVDQLLAPINPGRVLDLKGMAYVGAHDIKAHLIRIFGFGGWDAEILTQDLLFEEQVTMGNNKPGWYVGYKTRLRLTIKDHPAGRPVARYEESHVGDSTHPQRGEAHGNALTNSWSYALKRCATNLGDQFGLSLYDKGSRRALVRGTLAHPGAVSVRDVEDGVEVTSLGNDETRGEATTVPAAEEQAVAQALYNERPAMWGKPAGPDPFQVEPGTPGARAVPVPTPGDAGWVPEFRDRVGTAQDRGDLVGLWEELKAHDPDGRLRKELEGLLTLRNDEIKAERDDA